MGVPKYCQNGCACGEAGLAEEMETLAKSWASQVLKILVVQLPNQQSSDRFWIVAKSLEASQNEPNLEAFQLSRNTHSCIHWATVDGWKHHNWLNDAWPALPFLSPILPSPPTLAYASLLVLKSYECAVNLPSPVFHIIRYSLCWLHAAKLLLTSDQKFCWLFQ